MKLVINGLFSPVISWILISFYFILLEAANIPQLEIVNCIYSEFNGVYKLSKNDGTSINYKKDNSNKLVEFNQVSKVWQIKDEALVYKQLDDYKGVDWTLNKLDMSKYVVDICFSTDDESLDNIPTVLNSIQNNNILNRINVHYIHGEKFSKSKLSKIQEYIDSFSNLKLFLYSKSWGKSYNSMGNTDHISDATMVRIYIPELLPTTVKKLIYLDIDLVVNMDLWKLFNVDTGRTGIAIKSSLMILAEYINKVSKYGNCGVIVMNLEILRKQKFVQKCLKIHEKSSMNDQYLINIYANGSYNELDKRFNIFQGQDSELLKTSVDYIYHYAGRMKPYPMWISKSVSLAIKTVKYNYLWDNVQQSSKFDFLKKNQDVEKDKQVSDITFSEMNNNLLKHVTKLSKTKKINFGVLIYNNKFNLYSSSNVGDYVQSLAAMNIYRIVIQKYDKVEYKMDDFILLALKNEVPNFNFFFIRRDEMPDLCQYNGFTNIITIMNGWWMHPYDKALHVNFEIPPNLTPVFLSFHIADDQLLEDKFITIFKKFQPIGCRDEKTAEKLKSKGVNAFFSGCLTTTISFYRWKNQTNNRNQYFVDTVNRNPQPDSVDVMQMKKEYKNIEYPSESKRVVTSRLHCYLPCMAMGVPVKFVSPNGDENVKDWGSKDRFNGLMELNNDKDRFLKLRFNLTRMAIEKVQTLVMKIK